MDKEIRLLKIKLLEKEKTLKRFEKELKIRENLIELAEKYLNDREKELKEKLSEQGLSIAKDEDAVFLME